MMNFSSFTLALSNFIYEIIILKFISKYTWNHKYYTKIDFPLEIPSVKEVFYLFIDSTTKILSYYVETFSYDILAVFSFFVYN